ncbi:hypothetical protein BD779DRAFT_199820 [Infundibulicybe gibba]|nr:hypothetical protein BD779DRAFT_199820 [Infundibulicybe gibba]
MKLSTLFVSTSFVSSALAASCWGTMPSGVNPGNEVWTARSKLCNGSRTAPPNQSLVICSAYLHITSYENLYPSHSNAGTGGCWDATENIINQCLLNGYSHGSFSYNSNTWTMSATSAWAAC